MLAVGARRSARVLQRLSIPRVLSSTAVDAQGGGAVRCVMQDYWKQHSASGSIEEMMLDNNASVIEGEEREEILSMLPDVRDERVLELAAGVGRFTAELCQHAKAVTAVDFVQKFSDMNQEANSGHGNLRCICADVLQVM